MRFRLLCYLLFVPLISLFSQTKPPNFILILTDDQGWTSLSFPMDQKIPELKSDYFETPNMERLANMGMRFSRGYAPAAKCSPTRRSIQFGETPARQGAERFGTTHMTPEMIATSLPNMLKRMNAQYRTAHYGKWDLRADIFPEDIGYDESDGDTGNRNGNVFMSTDDKWSDVFVNDDPKRITTLTRRGMNFMERQVSQGNPFFLQISHYATHVDMQTREETFEKFKNKEKGSIHKLPGWAGMLADLDAGIGQLLDKLEDLEIEENTYIFLLADNGAVPFIPPGQNYYDHPSEYNEPSRNYPLRAGKWSLFEGGIRVPFLVAGPEIEKGSQCDHPVVGWDILPTIAELAGSQNKMPDHVDGKSIIPYLFNGNKGEVDRGNYGLIFHRYGNRRHQSAIILNKYKLIKLWDFDKIMLFDLEKDLEEVNDLSETYPEKKEELYRTMMEYLREVDAEVLQLFN